MSAVRFTGLNALAITFTVTAPKLILTLAMFNRLTFKKMTKLRPHRKLWILLEFFAAVMLSVALAHGASGGIQFPTDSEFDELTGEQLARPIKTVNWTADEPPRTNLLIYEAQPALYQRELFQSLARHLGIHGEVQNLPSRIISAPGYWIKEPNPTNKETWKSLIFSQISGAIEFGSGEDNHRWDLKNHKPLAHGVPSEKEALQRTLNLLPALGITTNELEHLPNGQLRYACNLEVTWYNDHYNNLNRTNYVRQINIELWQKIHDGASVLSLGRGGMLSAGFLSEGRLAEMEMTFRRIKPIGRASPKSSKELIAMLKKGDARTFRETVPSTVTITNCVLVYPEANSITKQTVLWPVYALNGFAVEDGETNAVHIYKPLPP